jgi:cell division protein FtsL
VIMMNKENYVNGNTVLAPSYEPLAPSKKQDYERLNKAKAENLIKKREKRVNSKAKTLRNIALVFIIGVTLIFRYASIYNIQKNLSNIKSEVVNLNKENENLKVELVKASNLNNVEKIATEKLHMVRTEKSNAIYMDLTKENFVKVASANKDQSQLSFLQKIYKMLF